MRQPALAVILIALVAFAGCGPQKVNAPPPTLPAAPVTPPLATPPPPAPEIVKQPSELDNIRGMDVDKIDRLGLLAEIHFDYDKADIREGDRQILAKNADVLKKYDFLKVRVEGHCDERGSVEYNLALGERRAKAAYDYLVTLGVPAGRLKTVSYGKEVPLCQEHGEECWARNRRAHFTVEGKTTGR